MKKKTILGVGLTLMLLGSLMAVWTPTSAGTLEWDTYTIPTTTNEVLSSCNVSDIAVYDEDIIFVGCDAAKFYKTTDGGVTWSTTDTDNQTNLIAVAPDDDDIIAWVTTSTNTVYVTDSGGTYQDSLGVPEDEAASGNAATEIRDIAISAEKAGSHYIAVAGIETTENIANVWYYELGATAPAWTETRKKAGFNTPAEDTYGTSNVSGAVAFSPNFASDEVMAVVNAGWAGTADNVTLELFSFDSKVWNEAGGFISYPAMLVENVTITGAPALSLSLDPEYLGSDDAMRLAFAGLYLEGDDDEYSGIYRADDTITKAIKDGATLLINSVAFNGSDLVAGKHDTNTTYYSSDPTATTPTVDTTSTYKRPGGEGEVVLGWAGDNVVAGTTGDESAFAVSTNSGKSFNDIALIDTTLSGTYLMNLTDAAVSADGETLYMVSDDGEDLSVFREASGWSRVLSIQGKKDFIVRTAPDDPDVVYVAYQAAKTIYYSTDGGETRWLLRTCGVEIQDLAVETDGSVCYALTDDGKVSKSTNGGFTWGTATSTKLSGGHMIASLGEDKVLVGSDDGYVAFSSDGNDSWTKILRAVVSTGGGDVVLTASGLSSGDFIYAAAKADDYIWRWEIGESTVWKKIYTSKLGEDMVVTGMVMQDGNLYAAAANATGSTTYRTFNPSGYPTVYWSTMTASANFTRLQSLKVTTSESNKLWAVDYQGPGTADFLYSYTDTLVDVAPTLVSPKQDFSVKINPVTGRASQVTFVWERPSDEVTAYDLKIAFDSGFDEEVASITVDETGSPISAVVGPGATNDIEWMSDTTYFWRVRVAPAGPIRSPYSEVRRFTIEEAKVTPPVTVEVPPTPEITVEVPPPTVVEVPPAPPAPEVPAPITPAYIWAIVIIGAILVIALIILIIRTRRAV